MGPSRCLLGKGLGSGAPPDQRRGQRRGTSGMALRPTLMSRFKTIVEVSQCGRGELSMSPEASRGRVHLTLSGSEP